MKPFFYKTYNPKEFKKTYHIFWGLLSFRRTDSNAIVRKINGLYKFLDNVIDLTALPPAKGVLRQQQLQCLDMLCKVKEVCDREDLDYWLDSGTLIGAVRHKGFIPWDNDCDLCMPREDFLKIIPLLKREMEDSKYFVRECAKNVLNLQIRIISKDDPKLGIDIFPLDWYYKDNLTEDEQQIVTQDIRLAREKLKKEKQHIAGTKYSDAELSQIREYIQKVTQEDILHGQPSKSKDGALFWAVDYMYSLPVSFCMNNNLVFPLKTIEFEGIEFKCPNDVDGYLWNEYGHTDIYKIPR